MSKSRYERIFEYCSLPSNISANELITFETKIIPVCTPTGNYKIVFKTQCVLTLNFYKTHVAIFSNLLLSHLVSYTGYVT